MKKGSKRTIPLKTTSTQKPVSKRLAASKKKVTAPTRAKVSRKSPAVRKKKPGLPAKTLTKKSKALPPEFLDLPYSYNETKLVLLVRDPFWAFAYWDFSQNAWDWIQQLFRKDPGAKAKLRVHNLDMNQHYDLEVRFESHKWYLDLGNPDQSFEAELGVLDSQGKFHSIVRSNRIRTPRNSPSSVIDPEWALSEQDFERLYKLSGGGQTGRGSELFSLVRKP